MEVIQLTLGLFRRAGQTSVCLATNGQASQSRGEGSAGEDAGLTERVLVISGYFPGMLESVGRAGPPNIVGWPAVFHTLDGFAREGWDIDWLILSEVPRQLPNSDAIRAHLIRVPLLRLCLGLWRRRWLWRLAGLAALLLNTAWAVPKAARIAKRRNPDAVYCFSESSILAGAVLRSLLGLKVVNRILGASSLCLGAWDSWSKLRVVLEDPWYASQFVLPADLKVITNDGSSARELAEMFGAGRQSRIFFELNGVDFPTVTRSRGHEGTLQVAVCSRLVEWKRVDLSIEAVAVARDAGADVSLLVFGGGGEEQQLKALASSRGVSDKVRWFGQVTQLELRERLTDCDVVVVAHRYCNLPNTLWESMAMGLCVIGVDDPGTRGVLAHLGNSYLVPQDFTAEHLGAAMAHLAANRRVVRELGRAARRWAQVNLVSWQERVSAELAVVREVAMESRCVEVCHEGPGNLAGPV